MSQNFYSQTMSGNFATSQKEAIPGREDEMVENNAGGFTFKIDMWSYLDRFLILGTEKSSYYVTPQKLTLEAAKRVLKCIKKDGVRTVNRIVEISDEGRAPKNDSALFALALCAVYGDENTVAATYAALPKVARIGTHLFQFVDSINELGKWNSATKRGIANWYNVRSNDRLAFQVIKYAQRNGWSHRDVLRLAHVKPKNDVQSNIFAYVVKGAEGIVDREVPKLVHDVESLKLEVDPKKVIKKIEENPDLTWEMIPNRFYSDASVWSALIPKMGLTALIRKLGQLSSVGLTQPFSEDLKIITAKLSDIGEIKNSRIHPITLLNALKQYARGAGEKGSLTWETNRNILQVLDQAFYDSFNFIESTGQNYLLGVDCSGSMFGCMATNILTAADVAAVMALAIAKREPNHWIGGFNTKMSELKISPNMDLDTVLKVMRNFNWGGTDCALPMTHAIQHKMANVDKFVVITDNETWAGRIHPAQALKKYRATYNKNAKLIVCGTSSTNFTIADPSVPGMLDVVGFDSSVPQLIQSF